MSITIDIKKDDLSCLELLAKKNGKNVNYYISKAVEKYLEDIENEYWFKIAEERSKDTSPTIPHEKVKEMYGL